MPAVKRIPERKCCGCGVSGPGKDMIRIVRTPEGDVLIDETGKKNGRGAYVCRNESCITKAAKKNSIGKSLNAQTDVTLYEELKKRCTAD